MVHEHLWIVAVTPRYQMNRQQRIWFTCSGLIIWHMRDLLSLLFFFLHIWKKAWVYGTSVCCAYEQCTHWTLKCSVCSHLIVCFKGIVLTGFKKQNKITNMGNCNGYRLRIMDFDFSFFLINWRALVLVTLA